MGIGICIGLGVGMNALALLFLSIAFATDHWIDYAVDRTTLKAQNSFAEKLCCDPLYFDRYRGLFRTCFPGTETYFFENSTVLESLGLEGKVIDGRCLKQEGYELVQSPHTVAFGKDYSARKHLMRAHVGFSAASLLFLLISISISAMGCWTLNENIMRYSGLMAFLGGFCAAGGMACFHGYDYLEKEKIDREEFRKHWMNTAPFDQGLANYSYGYSYMVCWVGVSLGLIAAIALLCATNSIAEAHQEEHYEHMKHKKKMGKMGPSAAYGYNDQPQMGYDYPTIGGPSAGHGYGYPTIMPGPLMIDPYTGEKAHSAIGVQAIEYPSSGVGYPY